MGVGTTTTGLLGGANNTNSAAVITYPLTYGSVVLICSPLSFSSTSPNDFLIGWNCVSNNQFQVLGAHFSSRAVGIGSRTSGSTSYSFSVANAINANPTSYTLIAVKDNFGKHLWYNTTTIDKHYSHSSTTFAAVTNAQKHTIFAIFGGGTNIGMDNFRLATLNPATTDTSPPVLISANVLANGTSLLLTYNESLGNFTTGLTLYVAGSTRTINTIAVSGNTITANIPAVIYQGQIVTLSYTQGDIQDLYGNLKANITSTSVINSSTQTGVPDTTPPTFTSKTVGTDGVTITLVTSEPVSNNTGLTIKVGGSAISVSWVNTNTTTITGTAGTTILSGQTVTLDYNQTTGDIIDTSGNELGALTNSSVTNNSAQSPDTTPPTFTSKVVATSGVLITLTTDETISGHAGLTLKVNGSAISVSWTNASANTITGVPATTILSGQTITLDYSQTTGDILDASNNEMATLTGSSVTNNSTQTVDTTPPTISTKVINSDGVTLVLTMSEDVTGHAGLSITVQGVARSVTWVNTNSTTITGTISTAVYVGESVLLSYDQTSGNILDTANNELATITNSTVTNNSTQNPPSGSSGLPIINSIIGRSCA